ncbi:glycerophosphodiester phosphodiesterase [Alteromonas flava]|uniref:glycerophosphodiester phosphodiesterase n=1 Tax=Alteromonas flava TaxID=2048003 RepID=UPI000C286A3A|nr:glycerophosphodiester phosphodiesterase family protein [Alteromonas flava]
MHIFAHRGASGHAPENTLAAIQLALDIDIYGVEIDIFQVEDEFVLMHDRWLTRTTGEKIRIDQVSLQQLSELNAGSYLDAPQKVPTLADVLRLNWQNKVLNIEIKAIKSIQQLYAYIERHRPATLSPNQIVLSSFNHLLLLDAQALELPYPRGWLSASMPVGKAHEAEVLDCQILGIDADVLNVELINDAHQRGIKVAVYTVDETDDIDWLKTLGVDAVFTNFPARVLQHLQQRDSSSPR